VVKARAFADHAAYDARMLARLARDARAAGAQLVTTEKDAGAPAARSSRQVLVLPVRPGIWTRALEAGSKVGLGSQGGFRPDPRARTRPVRERT
jgi:hypothetical protein